MIRIFSRFYAPIVLWNRLLFANGKDQCNRYNSWWTKEVLTKIKESLSWSITTETSLQSWCVRSFWLSTKYQRSGNKKMVCLSGRQLIGILVISNSVWPIRIHRKCIYLYTLQLTDKYTVDCRTITGLDNKFIEYYLLNDAFFYIWILKHPTKSRFFQTISAHRTKNSDY